MKAMLRPEVTVDRRSTPVRQLGFWSAATAGRCRAYAPGTPRAATSGISMNCLTTILRTELPAPLGRSMCD